MRTHTRANGYGFSWVWVMGLVGQRGSGGLTRVLWVWWVDVGLAGVWVEKTRAGLWISKVRCCTASLP
jgi:hypothetical protein